ncbi:uncharacterized protein LOC131957606 isoform X2 [Physella acuta]|uniref:uncharacterized protein LOC131957606 isoform X2 n=1 Tax=Physella acuta TaxID=109671 RepID=UPI0027DB0D67|nr:uncharacterized protein LOC131957606 isoform X2 [Physella acuta]
MNTTSSRGKLPSKDLTEKVEPYSRGIRSLSDLTSTIQEDGKKNTICTTSSRGKLPFKGPTEKVEPYSREIRSHSDLTSTIQEDGKKNTIYTTSSRRKFPSKTETKEKAVLKVSQDITKMWCWDGKTCNVYNVITFSDVETNEGNHFDPKIGVFTAPVYGLYEASLTIKQTGDRAVVAGVRHRSCGVVSRLCCVKTTEKSVEVSRTFEVPMKAGDVLYLTSSYSECECTHFSCSRLFSE